jgi:arginyl-tRNA synthetase
MISIAEEVKSGIIKALEQAAHTAKEKGVLDFENIPEFVLEVPREKGHGDFATNIAMLLTKQAKKPPRQIAEIIVETLNKENTWIEKIEIAGPGFINFTLDYNWLFEALPHVEAQGENYGNSQIGLGTKVQVEFVSANPTGLLHMGNARGAAIGDTLSNILKAAGYDVAKEFYVNDAGNQIENFGKSLEARFLQISGQDVPFPEDGYHGIDITETMENFINVHGREPYLNMDSKERKEAFVKFALQEKLGNIKRVLSSFGVEYDVWFSELSLHNSGAVTEVIDELKAKDYVYENEGALWFKSSQFGDDKDEVVVRSNGIPTYFAADIAYHKNKFQRGFQKAINIWGADHHGHVARVKGAIKAVGYDGDALEVILMQLVRLFKNGDIVRMSKRSGEFVTLEDLIEEVGKDAARYFFVMRSADSHLDFDMDLAKSQSADNPVFYIQYAHARICSILRQLEEKGIKVKIAKEVELNLLTEAGELELIRKISDLPGEIVMAANNLEPHRIARFAHELASNFHSFYNNSRVMVEDEKLMDARLYLINCTRITLKKVLEIMGISAPEKM